MVLNSDYVCDITSVKTPLTSGIGPRKAQPLGTHVRFQRD
jgi:hypothetical protein